MLTPLSPLPMQTPAMPAEVGTDSAAELKAPEKAAVIIGLLGAEYAGPIVEKIEDRHLRRFMETLGNLKDIPRNVMLGAVADFITELDQKKGGFKGGPKAAEAFMNSLFDEARMAALLGDGPKTSKPKDTSDIWAALTKSKAAEVTQFLSAQPAEVVSLILSQLTPIESGEILGELDEELSIACVRLMSRGLTPAPRTLEAIAEFVRLEFLEADSSDTSKEAALFVGDILGVLPRERRDAMLDILTQSDPEKADLIRSAMLTFEDLTQRLPTSAIPIIFKDMDEDKLCAALKAGEAQSAETIEFLYANISQRMAGQVKEKVANMPDLTSRQADKAVTGLMVFIGQLEKSGRITLIKAPSSEG